MKTRSANRRSIWLLIVLGFRAAPTWMTITALLNLSRGVILPMMAFSIRVLANGAIHHNNGSVAVGAAWFAVLFALNWSLTNIGVYAGFFVATRKVDLFLAVQIGEFVNRHPGIEHLERPDYLRELDLLNLRRRQLASSSNTVASLIYTGGRIVVSAILLAEVNPLFLLVPLLGVAPYFANSYGIKRRQRGDSAIAADVRLANGLFTMTATAAPAKELRIFGLAPELQRRHAELERRISKESDRAGLTAMVVGVAGWLVFAAGFVGLLAVVVVQAAHGHLSAGELVESIVLLQQAEIQLGQVTSNIGGIQQAKQAADRYIWLEDGAREGSIDMGSKPAPDRFRQGISLEHVTFRYPGTDAIVLNDVSLELPAGSTVAIVGENGAGKTTLAKLLTAMYRPSDGTIRVDGVDLSEFDPFAWRERVTATFQDFYNFELRAGHTVGIGDLPQLDDDDAVRAALGRVGSDGIVDELADGLDTLLGRSHAAGTDLSGGQWQKLALGRGQMRQLPLMLILDEPTSSLDAATEHALFEHHIRAAREAAATMGAITVVVSHRFSTVRTADLVIVLTAGEVTEIGGHDELLASGGLYAELFALQERGYR